MESSWPPHPHPSKHVEPAVWNRRAVVHRFQSVENMADCTLGGTSGRSRSMRRRMRSAVCWTGPGRCQRVSLYVIRSNDWGTSGSMRALYATRCAVRLAFLSVSSVHGRCSPPAVAARKRVGDSPIVVKSVMVRSSCRMKEAEHHRSQR